MSKNILAFLLSFSLCILAMPVFAKDATSYVPPDARVQSSIPVGTVATWPVSHSIPAGWMPCNGQAVPAAYPQLRSLMASVPNYNNKQFLRGSTSNVGSSYADTTRSHDHVVQPHSHTVTGTASSHTVHVGSQSVSGTAAGQEFVDYHQENRMGTGYRKDGGVELVTSVWVGAGGDPSHAHPSGLGSTARMYGHTETKTASSSSISGSTSGGTYTTSGGSVTGTALSVTGRTDTTGDSETAPQHTLVIYIIKHD